MRMERTSTSFPSSTPKWKYDVFLSFKGEDTWKSFTDHLYTALEHHGILTFKDDPELQKGKAISPEIFTAIQDSRFALIVLSKHYAASTWCLDELLKILECMEARETVLPIFYEVNPSDVRKQTGNFTEAFTKHEENFRNDLQKVQRWREALTKVANLSGWDSKDWYESELIKNIVELVWKNLRPTLLSDEKDLVGMDSRLKEINLFLDGRVEDVCFFGIWGMGGIGKTTIARVLFERISHEFEFSIFLANVRNNFVQSGLAHLQKQLLSKIGIEKEYIWDIGEGVKLIKRFLCHRKVLLVLDDVNHLDQLEYLAGNREWFGFGSRVLITTRDEHLLITHGVDRTYEVQGLSDHEALQLLSWKAFKRDYPEQSYVDLCNCVVDYVRGLPLAVKVLGSFLHGRDRSAWKSALDKLREVCNLDILETLKISYDGLDYDEKKIFLDIACFFNWKGKDRVRETLDACGFYADIGIYVLVEKSLLTNSDGILWMHDLIQEMGREIIRRESPDDLGRRSRLWRRKDIDQVLSENTVRDSSTGLTLVFLYTIEGIMVHPFELELVTANARSFSMMNKLRYLKLNNVDLSNGLEYLPDSLRILEWPKFPLKYLPSSFNPEDLIELNMHHSCLNHIKPIKSLKMIDLSYSLSLVKTPDFRGIPVLERLILKGCIRLYEIDSSVVVLKRLTLMNLKDCKNLIRLPSSVRGLKSLKVLNVSGCSKLEKLPEDLGHVEGLEELDVSGTAVREPPSSIGLLKDLKVLSFNGCKGPSSKAWNIMLFPFRPRPLLKVSPNATALWLPSLSGFRSLTELDLSDCNLLEGDIPSDLGHMSSLKFLYLSGNPFASLPSSIAQLSQLESLAVGNCPKLQALPDLPSSMSSVEAYNCNSLGTSSADIVKLLSSGFKFTGSQCDFVVPGNEIPEWFNHKSLGSSLSVELRPGWFTDKWMGFALCAVFGQPRPDFILCELSVNGKRLEEKVALSCWLGSIQAAAKSGHLWLCYLSRHKNFVSEWQNIHTRLEFSFPSLQRRVEVEKCAVCLVYEEDVEVLLKQTYPRQSRVDKCEEVLEFPESGFEKADGIAKRGCEYFDVGAGPSQTQSQGERDRTTSIDEEPDPKRSKQH
ncbi:unnamed protein product [Prunus armeniaca]